MSNTIKATDDILNRLPSLAAWLLVIILSGLYFMFIAPAVPVPLWLICIHFGHFFIICVQLAFACRIDPGFYPSNVSNSHNEFPNQQACSTYRELLVRGVRVRTKWCSTCEFYRPPRCSHCSECDRCVEHFDHHCPWLNNCVGRRNYPYFFRFLSMLTVHSAIVCAVSLFVVLRHRQNLTNPEVIISICVLGFTGLLNFPIFGLFGFHVVLISRGHTTNEQVTGKYKELHGVYTRGCFVNIIRLFMSPPFPSIDKKRRIQKRRHKRKWYGSLRASDPEELHSTSFQYNHNYPDVRLSHQNYGHFPLIDEDNHKGCGNIIVHTKPPIVEYDNLDRKFGRSESYRQAQQMIRLGSAVGEGSRAEQIASLLNNASSSRAKSSNKYEISV